MLRDEEEDVARPAWTKDKTFASVKFVNDAIEYLKDAKNEDDIRRLEQRIRDIKCGAEVLIKNDTIEVFLKSILGSRMCPPFLNWTGGLFVTLSIFLW